jgi:hypothetical protein
MLIPSFVVLSNVTSVIFGGGTRNLPVFGPQSTTAGSAGHVGAILTKIGNLTNETTINDALKM